MKIKPLFLTLAMSVSVVSCKEENHVTTEADALQAGGSTKSASIQSVKNYDGFEGSNIADFWYTSSLPAHTSLSTSAKRNGSKSFKAWWQASYYDGTNASKHSEIAGIYPPLENRENWYGWSVYFPTTSDGGNPVNKIDSEPMIITQWHTRVSAGLGPPVTFSVENGTWKMTYKWGNKHEQDFSRDLGTLPSNKWVDLVVHVKWSTTGTANDGLIELWKNGNKFYSKTNIPVGGGAASNDGQGWPYFKIGIYHYTGKANGLKMVHFDDVRHGYNSSYSEVAPPALN